MADQAGPGKGDGPADTGRSVKFSTQPTNISTEPLSRPEINGRGDTDSPLAPHQRTAADDIPVTPGEGLRTYEAESVLPGREPAGSSSYFSTNPGGYNANSQDSLDDDMAVQSPEADGAAALSGEDILRRMSQSSRGRRETVGDVKAAWPSLPLSGDIISATFNMPHSLKYRKGEDWVSGWSGEAPSPCCESEDCC